VTGPPSNNGASGQGARRERRELPQGDILGGGGLLCIGENGHLNSILGK
jgi:hypothetical protein